MRKRGNARKKIGPPPVPEKIVGFGLRREKAEDKIGKENDGQKEVEDTDYVDCIRVEARDIHQYKVYDRKDRDPDDEELVPGVL
jgi:hypothetical protein